MSGQYLKDGAKRITNNETLLVRKELINLFGKENIIKTNLIDQHGNDNLLLPNFIEEKLDNGDIDIFLYFEQDTLINEEIVKILKNSKFVLKINKNDKVYSFLFQTSTLEENKTIQIDLHLVVNTKNNLANYFNYYRVPYLYFIFGMIFRKLNIKLGTTGLNYVVEFEQAKHFIRIEDEYIVFLEKILQLDIEELNKISSFKELGNFVKKTGLVKYDFFNFEKMKGKYLKKMRNNTTLLSIIESFGTPSLLYTDYEETFKKELLEKYPTITEKVEKFKLEVLEKRKNAEIRRNNLCTLFNVEDLKQLNLEQKQLIPKIKELIPELLILKEVYNLLKTNFSSNSKTLYLVGGGPRDILLGKSNKDWDLTGNYSSLEFQKAIGGTITEKFGTVFVIFKGLEIEYTPFRKESNYDGRKPGVVTFDATLVDDSLRRDFTINSMYLNIENLEIIDIYNGKKDLENKLIKAVGNPDDRFSEDYLRILRGIRLTAKIEGKIEEKTYNSMLKLSNNLNNLSNERLMEELFKGFNINENRTYILHLNDFGNDSKLFPNILSTYKSLNNSEIYTLLYYIGNKDKQKIQAIPGEYSGKTKKLFILGLKHLDKKIPKIINKTNLKNFLYELSLGNYTRKEITKLLIIIGNLNILEGKLNKKELTSIIKIKKEIDKNKENYTMIQLKENGLDVKKEISSNNIKPHNIKTYLKEKYINV